MRQSSQPLLRALRALKGLSQHQLAEALGRSQSWLSRVESGQFQVTSEQAQQVARVFDLQGEERALLLQSLGCLAQTDRKEVL